MPNKRRLPRTKHWVTRAASDELYLALLSYAYEIATQRTRLVCDNGAIILPRFGWLRGKRPQHPRGRQRSWQEIRNMKLGVMAPTAEDIVFYEKYRDTT